MKETKFGERKEKFEIQTKREGDITYFRIGDLLYDIRDVAKGRKVPDLYRDIDDGTRVKITPEEDPEWYKQEWFVGGIFEGDPDNTFSDLLDEDGQSIGGGLYFPADEKTRLFEYKTRDDIPEVIQKAIEQSIKRAEEAENNRKNKE